jgi:hypothetical protein
LKSCLKIKNPPGNFLRVTILSALLLSTSVLYADFEFLDINEGELDFITRPLKTAPHHHSTHISITADSLTSGWIGNKQCHYNLQPVPAMEIVFRRGRVRNIEITRTENIGRAWIEEATIQLESIKKGAVICVSSETLSIKSNGGRNRFIWSGGPYMKKFLDGYFPMKVSVAIDYPSELLALEKLFPQEVELKSTKLPGHIRLSVMFEGILSLETHFVKNQQ